MWLALQLIADATDQTGATPAVNPLLQFLPFIFIIILFYFFMIRAPMKKQEHERQSLLGNMKKNDEVVTSGGMIGVVGNIPENGDEVTLKLDDNVRVRVLKSAIVRNLSREKQAKEQKEAK